MIKMHKCILCDNSTTSLNPDSLITYHSFPRNLIRRNHWVERLKMDRCFDWQRICSDHFKDEDFRPGGKRLLRISAIPVLPTNTLRPREEPLASNDTNLVNNTANLVNSPRRSSRKIKRPRQLLDNEDEETSSTLVVAPTDSQTPKSNARQKTTVRKKNAVCTTHCCIIDCDSTYSNSKVSFFRFPEQNSLRDVWLECCGTLMTLKSKRNKLIKMCGKHFEVSMFMNSTKRNRLKSNAVPTIFFDKDGSNISLSTTLENNNVASTSVEESTSSTCSVPPSVELNENMTGDVNMDDTNTNIGSLCCIPGCISNISEEETGPELIFLFNPPIEEISKWSSILGMQITQSSLVCENHFKSQDIIHPNPTEKLGKKLVPGAVPLGLKPYEDESENHLSYADPPNGAGHPALKLDVPSIDTLPQTMINSSNISQSSPIHNEHTPAVDISDVDANSILRKTLETNNEKKCPDPFCNSSVSMTMESSDDTNKQISSDNSTEVINTTSILKPTLVTESDGILSASTSSSPQSNLIKILPKTFTDGSLSITMKSITKQNKPLSEIDSTEINNSVDMPTFSTDNFISNSIESTLKNPYLKNLVNNNSVSITREPSHKQSKSIPTINSTDEFESASTSKQIKKLKLEPIDNILPTTDPEINFDQILSDKLAKIAQFTHSNTTINEDGPEQLIISDVVSVDPYDTSPRAKKIKLEPINAVDNNDDDDEFPITSTNNVNMLNSQTSIEMTENIDEDLTNINLLLEISKTVVLPHAYWRSLYNENQNSLVFIERNELFETIKKVYFENNLVPIIYINYKRFEYNNPIDTTIALENLLVEIDNIKICSGYDGHVHDYCMGYLEDSSEESEVCSKCNSLVHKECFASFDTLILDKLNTIQNLKNKITEREERLLEIKKRFQQKKNVGINIYKSSKPVVCQR